MDTTEIGRLERELPLWETADLTAFNDLEGLMMRTAAKLGREVLHLRARIAAADRMAEWLVQETRDIVTGQQMFDDARPDIYVGDIIARIDVYRAAHKENEHE